MYINKKPLFLFLPADGGNKGHPWKGLEDNMGDRMDEVFAQKILEGKSPINHGKY